MVSLFPPSPSQNLFRLVGVNAEGKHHAKVYLHRNLASVCSKRNENNNQQVQFMTKHLKELKDATDRPYLILAWRRCDT